MRIAATNFTKNDAGLRARDQLGWGGALFLGPLSSVSKSSDREKGLLRFQLRNVDFIQNVGENGGAVACIHVSIVSMVSVKFTDNLGWNGGAMYIETNGDSNPRQSFLPSHYVNGTNASFDANVAVNRGGAVFLKTNTGTASLAKVGISPWNISDIAPDGSNNNEDDMFFESTEFKQNKASKYGGALYVERGRVGCKNCRFLRNSINDNPESGGGAIALTAQAAFHGRKVSFAGNSATTGGAIYAEDALVDIVNSSINGNVASENGGGIYIYIPNSSKFEFDIFGRLEGTTMDGNEARIGGMPQHEHLLLCDFRIVTPEQCKQEN